jgi:hypothetical protein
MAFGDFTVTRASTKNVLGSAGLYVSVANNVPAFEFNTDGTYRGLLVEPGATNLALYSQEFDNSYWTKTSATITTNASVAPDGTTTADAVVTSGGVLGRFSRAFTVANDSTAYALSVFVKKEASESYGVIILGLGGGTGRSTGIQYNKQTGVAQYVGDSFGVGFTSPISINVLELTDYWRFSFSLANNSTGNTVLTTTFFVNRGTSFGNFSAVDGTSTVWQAQLETGSVATSPIVTAGSTVARVADVVSLTGASSLIGQTGGGTLFVEVDWRATVGVTQTLLSVSFNVGNRCQIASTSANELVMTTLSAGGAQTNQGQSNAGYTGLQRIAFRYEQNNAALYRNGASISTDMVFDISGLLTMGKVNIGSQYNDTIQANMWIRSVALFSTPLADAQLASITTL